MKFQGVLPRQRVQAFTLIELLIALLLVGIILAAVVYVNIETARASAALQARNQLLPELQVAQNYMAGKLKQAAYVFQDGANISMAASGATTYNAPQASYNWRVGRDPIVAFILPPKMVGKTVTVSGTPTQIYCATARDVSDASDLCYAFYAFYAIKRSGLVDPTTGVKGADNPGVSSVNDATAQVLMEYRGYYSRFGGNPFSPPQGYRASTSDIPTGNAGQLLMDYLPVYPTGTKLFQSAGTTNNATTEVPGSTTVTMNLAAQQIVAAQTIRLPSGVATDFNTLVVYPRNVGKTPLLN